MERISSDHTPEPRPPKRRKPVRREPDYYQPQDLYREDMDRFSGRRRPAPQRGGQKKRRSVGVWFKESWKSMVEVLFNRRLAFDKPLVIIVLLLLFVGLMMMYSASYAYAFHENHDSIFYIRKQLVFAFVGLLCMFGVSTISPDQYKGNVTLILMGICYFLLALVLALPRIEHVHRWINLGFTTFQPSEIAKFAAILWCATYISDHYKEINITSYPDLETKARVNRSKVRKWFYSMGQSFMTGVLPFLIWLGPMLVLIVIEPHLSCTVLMVLIIGTMMFVGGTNKGFFTILIALAVLAGYLVIYTDIVPYGSKRIKVWQDPFYDKLGDGWQNIQSLYAISSGGLFGVGIGNSKQKYLYIAEPQNDFVFAVICEEVGLIGAMLVVAMFVFFVWRGFSVSLANPNRFCKLVGIGITAQIGFQMLLNICVVTNMVPNTGISLPFFSYGGTSLMMLLLEIGVLLAISRTSPNKII